jgi:aminoglycoside phosphotransferase (APT) family kinase protein
MDIGALERWLAANVSDLRGPVSVHRFAGGQSSPTCRLSAASGTYVLRKKPDGALLPSAHAVDREHRSDRRRGSSVVSPTHLPK